MVGGGGQGCELVRGVREGGFGRVVIEGAILAALNISPAHSVPPPHSQRPEKMTVIHRENGA